VVRFALVAILLSFGFLGCKGSNTFTKGEGDKSKIEVRSGEAFVIELAANPSTGFNWELVKPLDKELLELTKTEYSGGNPALVGSGCSQEWKFMPLKPGETSIYLQYRRPWEKGIPAAKTAEFEVTIK
jgi:inhibitor of cysteine peptidase